MCTYTLFQYCDHVRVGRIRVVLKPARSSVTRVEKENVNGTRTIINNKEKTEKEIGRVNMAKLM